MTKKLIYIWGLFRQIGIEWLIQITEPGQRISGGDFFPGLNRGPSRQ